MEQISAPPARPRHNLVCPITLDVYRNPVFTGDGHVYERVAIIERILLIILAISPIITPFVITTSIIFDLHQSDSNSSSNFTYAKRPNNFTYRTTMYKLPNNGTLSNILPLLSWDNADDFGYTYYKKSYKAVSTRTIITFTFPHDLSYWCLNNVSVFDVPSKIELMTNGDFENNPPNRFIPCNSAGNNSTTFFFPSAHPHNRRRSFCDSSIGLSNYFSQTLHTKIEQIHRVSF